MGEALIEFIRIVGDEATRRQPTGSDRERGFAECIDRRPGFLTRSSRMQVGREHVFQGRCGAIVTHLGDGLGRVCRGSFLTGLVLPCLILGQTGASDIPLSKSPDDWYRVPASGWASRVELSRPVEGAELDPELLAAAVFYASNEQRVQAGLLRLWDNPRARAAAALQASLLASLGQVQHTNPLPGEASPHNRLRASGLAALRVAENLARTPILVVPESGSYSVDETTGRRVVTNPRSGEALPYRTYGEVAAAIVQQWMESPRHRANLLSRQVSGMGCAVRFARLATGMEVVYAVQILFDPLDPRR